jgi:hypothetical protein
MRYKEAEYNVLDKASFTSDPDLVKSWPSNLRMRL